MAGNRKRKNKKKQKRNRATATTGNTQIPCDDTREQTQPDELLDDSPPQEDLECRICMEPLNPIEPPLSCGHRAHRYCVQRHLQAHQLTNFGKNRVPPAYGRCPLCREYQFDIQTTFFSDLISYLSDPPPSDDMGAELAAARNAPDHNCYKSWFTLFRLVQTEMLKRYRHAVQHPACYWAMFEKLKDRVLDRANELSEDEY